MAEGTPYERLCRLSEALERLANQSREAGQYRALRQVSGQLRSIAEEVLSTTVWVDAQTLGESLKIAPCWFTQAAREGLIPYVQIGNEIRFNRTAVLAALEQAQARDPPPW